MYIYNGSPMVTIAPSRGTSIIRRQDNTYWTAVNVKCTFSGNEATANNGRGGGVYYITPVDGELPSRGTRQYSEAGWRCHLTVRR